MSETRAIATKPFEGAPDGDVYPVSFDKGHPVAGDLADVVIGLKWARQAKDDAEFDAAVAARISASA